MYLPCTNQGHIYSKQSGRSCSTFNLATVKPWPNTLRNIKVYSYIAIIVTVRELPYPHATATAAVYIISHHEVWPPPKLGAFPCPCCVQQLKLDNVMEKISSAVEPGAN